MPHLKPISGLKFYKPKKVCPVAEGVQLQNKFSPDTTKYFSAIRRNWANFFAFEAIAELREIERKNNEPRIIFTRGPLRVHALQISDQVR